MLEPYPENAVQVNAAHPDNAAVRLWQPEFISRLLKVSAAALGVFVLGAAVFGKAGWIIGSLAAWAWAYADHLFLARIVRMVQSGKRSGPELWKWCLIKFPALYLVGLGGLLLPFVKIPGVIAGLSIYWWVGVILLFSPKIKKA